ncbi:MAG TPA: sulfotransferase [Thermoguttaceae bacterium]|nr:sulfotransferase [Thermoguttaceae bacterium]
MAKGSKPSSPGATGGSKDHFWTPRFWYGMGVRGYSRLMRDNRFDVEPHRWFMAVLVGGVSAINSGLWAAQEMFFGRKIRRTSIDQQPIFIIGHWRSGTTLLHELLVLDRRHTFPSNYCCFAPNHFVLTDWLFPKLLWFLMPSRRPMDNMELGWRRPQEDEFALANMGVPSPYTTIAFPNRPPQNNDYFNLESIPPEALARWKERFTWFLKCLTFKKPGRVVLKSPPHTCRIKHLLDVFPDARFVHIVRDPYVLSSSTRHLWRRLYEGHGFQKPKCNGLDEYVYETFNLMYETFEAQRGLIPPGRLSEVRYEDLVADPIGQMRRIYDELELGGFDDARPAMEKHMAQAADYKTNRYTLPDETREQITRRWGRFIERFGYGNGQQAAGSGQQAAGSCQES